MRAFALFEILMQPTRLTSQQIERLAGLAGEVRWVTKAASNQSNGFRVSLLRRVFRRWICWRGLTMDSVRSSRGGSEPERSTLLVRYW